MNAGSALAANGIAVNVLVTTNTAAVSAGLVWMILFWLDNKPSVMGIVIGAVVGLAAITPAGYVTPLAAIEIGAIAAPISYCAIRFRQKRNLDESLDVWACHGMGGAWGALATGHLASKAMNDSGADGLFYGNPTQFVIQAVAVAASIAFAFGATFVIAKLLNWLLGLHVSAIHDEVGLDISEHGEQA